MIHQNCQNQGSLWFKDQEQSKIKMSELGISLSKKRGLTTPLQTIMKKRFFPRK